MNENRKGPVRYVKSTTSSRFEDHAGPCEFVKAPLITNHSSNHEEPDSTMTHNSIIPLFERESSLRNMLFLLYWFYETKHNQGLS